jgi:hypothetical protein
MQAMHWSWEDMENTPPYVKRYCIDLLSVKRRAEAAARDRANRPRG